MRVGGTRGAQREAQESGIFVIIAPENALAKTIIEPITVSVGYCSDPILDLPERRRPPRKELCFNAGWLHLYISSDTTQGVATLIKHELVVFYTLTLSLHDNLIKC